MPNGNWSAAKANEWLASVGGYVALHFDNPELSGAEESEVTGGGYARDNVIWTAPSSKTIWNTNSLAYSGLVAGTITYIAGWDALTGGTMDWYALVPNGGWAVTTGAGILISPNDIALSFP